MKLKTKFIKRWKAETPIFWKTVRNTSAVIISVVSIAMTTVNATGLQLPDNTSKYCAYTLLVAGAITAFAGTRVKK